MNSPKINWFPTLSEALASEGLSALWPWESSIAYGEDVRHIVEHEGVTRLISIYRETNGLYERPVHYVTSVDKKDRDVYRDAARYRWLRDHGHVNDRTIDEEMNRCVGGDRSLRTRGRGRGRGRGRTN